MTTSTSDSRTADNVASPQDVTVVRELHDQLCEQINSVFQGNGSVTHLLVVALFAEGHLLIEDVPGVGKTALAKSLARSIDSTIKRVQFTPDLLPSDITGTTIYQPGENAWEFRPGAVFANIVLADEINRAGPKTQAALLEAMAERTVSVDGTTHPLAAPFVVIATQNPIELEGTYPLPEAQRDRFLMRLSMGYPDLDAEVAVLTTHGRYDAVETLHPVATASNVLSAADTVRRVHTANVLQRYIVQIVRSTRSTRGVTLGCSPRSSLALLRAAQSAAACSGRHYVIPDDVKHVAVPVLAHRIILSNDGSIGKGGAVSVIESILNTVPVPSNDA